MTTDFPTASAGTSQAPSAAVEKSHSASHTEIRTLPIKRQLGQVTVRYLGQAKNTAHLHALFALFNLWKVRRTLWKEARG